MMFMHIIPSLFITLRHWMQQTPPLASCLPRSPIHQGWLVYLVCCLWISGVQLAHPLSCWFKRSVFSDEQLETSGNRSLQSPWYSLSLVHLARLISKPWWTIFGNLPRRHQTGFHLQHLGTSKSRLCPKSDSDSLRVHGFMLAPHRPWQTFAQDWFDTKTGKQKTLGLCDPIASAFPMCNRRYAHL